MTIRDNIHSMNSGSEMDKRIFETVYKHLRPITFVGDMPSQNLEHAWDVMIVMCNKGYRPRIIRVAENEWACSMDLDEPTAYSSHVPTAICRAALLTEYGVPKE